MKKMKDPEAEVAWSWRVTASAVNRVVDSDEVPELCLYCKLL